MYDDRLIRLALAVQAQGLGGDAGQLADLLLADAPDAANLAAERLEGILEGYEARVDVTNDGWVSLVCAPEVAERLGLEPSEATQRAIAEARDLG